MVAIKSPGTKAPGMKRENRMTPSSLNRRANGLLMVMLHVRTKQGSTDTQESSPPAPVESKGGGTLAWRPSRQ